MKKLLALMLFSAALFSSRAGVCATEIDRIVAIVGPDAVTLSEIQTEMAPALADINQRYRGAELASAVDKLKRSTLNSIIDKHLQIQEAKVQGIEVTDEEVNAAIDDIMKRNKLDKASFITALANEGYTYDDYKKTLGDQLLIMRLVGRAIKSKISIKEEEIVNYFNQNKAKFVQPETVRVANILFPVKGNDMDAALKDAQDARAKIMAGTPFEEMAATCTGNPDAAKSCVLGSFKRGELSPDVEAKAFSMAAGEVSEPLKTDKGYQLVKIMEKTPGKEATLEDVRPQIIDELTSKQGETLFADWLQELRKHTYVEIRSF